jgi:hypothetical protein
MRFDIVFPEKKFTVAQIEKAKICEMPGLIG